MLLFPSYSPYLITLAINFSFDNHRSCLACRCQFTLIFRFSSIARYRSRDCDKLVVVRGGISRTNFPASPLHHTGFASDFPTKESLLFELTLLSTMLGCCKSAPKKSNSRIFFCCGEKIKLFSANNDYAQLFTQVDLDYTHHPLQVVLYFQLILNLG